MAQGADPQAQVERDHIPVSTLLKKRQISEGILSAEDEDWILLGHLRNDYKRVKRGLVEIRDKLAQQ